uniref:G domain-containing protein n=1 Tax=Sparus aurata TaxID=8175 RepID=A0A671TX57_SPAAU
MLCSLNRDNQSALQYVKNYKPHAEGQQVRILLHGPVGAGKSSFINSVQSVLHGRMYTLALADNTSDCSFTKKYTTYKIQKGGPDSFYPFVFNDIMGLDRNGVPVDDVRLALQGHVKDGYRFNPVSKMSNDDPYFNQCPAANDIVHVLVCVVPADTVHPIKDEMVKKIREIREEASSLGIPQMAILTKIDMTCPEIQGNLKKVYLSRHVKKKMEQFSADVGIPMNCIFPVENYHNQIDLDSDVNSLILSALRDIIKYGDDFINLKKSNDRLICFNVA